MSRHFLPHDGTRPISSVRLYDTQDVSITDAMIPSILGSRHGSRAQLQRVQRSRYRCCGPWIGTRGVSPEIHPGGESPDGKALDQMPPMIPVSVRGGGVEHLPRGRFGRDRLSRGKTHARRCRVTIAQRPRISPRNAAQRGGRFERAGKRAGPSERQAKQWEASRVSVR